MASLRAGTLPSVRRQHLLAEFAGLKQACPEGVFVSLTPGDPTLWSGVIFVRKGPYATAILRFQISFPDTYPSLPPLVTFSTDIFHPLITPLTTYMYTTDIQDNGTVSATDDERLPPGGFSLRHGFPDWFGRGGRQSRVTSGTPHAAPAAAGPAQTPPRSTARAGSVSLSNQSTPGSGPAGTPSYLQTQQARRDRVSTYDVLRYIRGTFDDEAALDAVPLEAAGNPGAWHAWRTHRRQQGRAVPGTTDGDLAWHPALPGDSTSARRRAESISSSVGVGVGVGTAARKPGDWNWEHVWEERVKKGIAASLSEPVLYGNAGAADDVIRFLSMEESDVDAVKENLKRTLGAGTAA